MKKRIFALCALAAALCVSVAATAQERERNDRRRFAGNVYTMSNAADGNAILVYDRLPDGRLVLAARVATGGNGTGAGLGNQGGIVLSRNERWLLAVNAASNSLSVFEVRPRGLRLTDVEATGGVRPISVTEHRGVVYVVHAGSDNIAGFTLGRDGHLRPIDGSVRALSGSGVGPAQIAFTPDGDFLLVTEKATNALVTYAVDREGLPSEAQVQPSSGQTPFGFAFGRRDQVFVSEAFGGAPDGSATSSYEVGRDGTLTPISASVTTHQTAACWAVVTPDGKFAYVANAGSSSVSGYDIDEDGQIALLDADGRTGVTGDGTAPIDLALTSNGRYLYSLDGGTNTIAAFRIERDGALVRLPSTSGLPQGVNGLAAR